VIPVEFFRSERFRSVLCTYLESRASKKDGRNQMRQAQDELTREIFAQAAEDSSIVLTYSVQKNMCLPIHHPVFREGSTAEMEAILQLAQTHFGINQSSKVSRVIFALAAEVSGHVHSSLRRVDGTDGPLQYELIIVKPTVEQQQPEAVEIDLIERTLSALSEVSSVSSTLNTIMLSAVDVHNVI
jgi:hypothetical protein